MLSLIAKTVLAWLVFFGVMQPARCRCKIQTGDKKINGGLYASTGNIIA
jgi:hypothetical protein